MVINFTVEQGKGSLVGFCIKSKIKEKQKGFHDGQKSKASEQDWY